MISKYLPVVILAFCSFLPLSCQKNIPSKKFKNIHERIYKSITITDKSHLYDALSEVFTKNEIEKNFARVSKFQEKNKLDHVQVFVDDIEYKDIQISGHYVIAHWIVRGRIKHKAHQHQRSLEYKAGYTLTQENEKWRIKQSEIMEYADFELSEKERELGTPSD